MFYLKNMNISLPTVNQRIKFLIDKKYNGNIALFSKEIGFEQPQKINRLFKLDTRSNEYPNASIDILVAISNKFDISLDFLVFGKKTENINNNVIGDDSVYLISQLNARIDDKERIIKDKEEIIKLLKEKIK